MIQSGRIDEDEHYYLDTEKDYGYIIELGNAGRIRARRSKVPDVTHAAAPGPSGGS